LFQEVISFDFVSLQKDLLFKEATAIYIRSSAYFEFVINMQTKAAGVVKLVKDVQGRIGKLAIGIVAAETAAAEKEAESEKKGKEKKKKKAGSGKRKAGAEVDSKRTEGDVDDEVEKVAALLKKLKQKVTSIYLCLC
jgi:hypothetical protein